jgi:hypothetical protein
VLGYRLEVRAPDLTALAGMFFLGANPITTGPSWFLAADCSLTIPVPTDVIGFPDAAWIINVRGCMDACSPDVCPGEGCCYAPSETPGCDDAACCDLVCAVDPFCCDSSWDDGCSTAAVAQCFDSPCAGDVNGDATVDVSDLTAVILDWGMTGSGLAADVAPNCAVDVGDLTEVILAWGSCD